MIPVSTSSANTSLSQINVSPSVNQFGSPDEAADFLSAVLLERGNRLIGMVKNQLDSTEIFFSKMSYLSDLMNRFTAKTSGPFVDVTLESLAAASKTRDELRTLISSAGPTLGDTTAEVDAFLAELAQSGVSIRAPGQTLVLVETSVATASRENDTSVSRTLKWLSDEDVNLIRQRASRIEASPTYPGADKAEQTYRIYSDEEAKWLRATDRTTIFTDYRVRRPDAMDVAVTLITLRTQFDTVLANFAEALAQTNKAITKLDEQVRDGREASEDALRTIAEFRQKQNEDMVDFLRILRLYRELKVQAPAQMEKVLTNMDGQPGALATVTERLTEVTAQPPIPPANGRAGDSMVELAASLPDLAGNKAASAVNLPPPGMFVAALVSMRSGREDWQPQAPDAALAGLATADGARTAAQTTRIDAPEGIADRPTEPPQAPALAGRKPAPQSETNERSEARPTDFLDGPLQPSKNPGSSSPVKE